MPNPIKYTAGTETLALKKGNFYIGTGDVGKGPSDTTGYYQGPNVPSGGYVIYLNKEGAPGGLSYHSAANDAQLIAFTNNLAGQSYTGVNQCFDYYYTQNDKVLVNQDYPPDYPYIVMDGLVLNLDAGITQSYPGSETTWTDVNGLGPKNNGTLINGPTFNSANGGSIVFDGTNDYVGLSSITLNPSGFTIDMFIYVDSPQPSYANFWSYWAGSDFSLEIGVYETPSLTGRFNFKDNTTNSLVLSPYVGNQWSQLTFGCSQRKPFMYTNGLFIENSETLFRSTNLSFSNIFRVSNRYFKGKQGSLRIYNRALSAGEILQNYNATKGRFGL
jgi:hypothetical protein